jgi:hypothetical protein
VAIPSSGGRRMQECVEKRMANGGDLFGQWGGVRSEPQQGGQHIRFTRMLSLATKVDFVAILT